MGWLAKVEPDPALVRALREIDPKADVRWVPGPSERPPTWEFGVWWDPTSEILDGVGRALDNHLRLGEEKTRPAFVAACQAIREGWRPMFGLTGRNPDGRDVEEFRKRDHIYRTGFDAHLKKIEAEMCDEEVKRAEIGKTAEDWANDKTLYSLLTLGRKSVVVQGFKKG